MSQTKGEKISFLYANNEFMPTKIHLKKIDSIKSLYTPHEFSIALNGYANEIGRYESNLNLSKKRVKLIANEFKNHNFTSSIGKGELNGDLIFNRRVDLEFKKLTKTIKVKKDS